MEKFTIYLPFDTYVKGNDILDTFGDFHIKLGDHAFPGEGWTDFGRDLVLHWINDVIQILNNETKVIECDFMDGAYLIYFKEITKQIWKISLVREWFDGEKDGETVEKEAEVSSLQVVNEILEKAIARIKLDKQRGEKYKDLNDSIIKDFEIAKQNYFKNS
jgi:hypothetical protein